MSSAKKAGITQFSGDGYDTWKFRVETQLAAHGVREAIDQDPPAETAEANVKSAFKEKDEKAKALLVAYLADSHLEYVRDKSTAKAMWTSLANTFAKKGFAAQTYIRRSLALLRMEEGGALKEHFRRFDELVRQLKDAGATLTELDQVSQLFISLPASYDVVTTAMENLPDTDIKLETVKARLLAEEQKRNGRDNEAGQLSGVDGTVLAARTKRLPGEKRKFAGKCFGCKAFGHKQSECPKGQSSSRNYAQARAADVRYDTEVALTTPRACSETTDSDGLVWILDSGASRHMASKEAYFSSFTTLEKPVSIESAKNEGRMFATKEGVIRGKVETSERKVALKLSKVLYVPNLQFNLLSLAALLQVGVKVEFLPDRAIMKKDGQIIAEAMMNGNLFYVHMKEVVSGTALAVREQDGNDNLDLWHKRYGHLSYRNVKRLQQSTMVHGIGDLKGDEGFCEECAESNLNRMPFKGSITATTRPLERIHTDVCGKITLKTYNGFQYFV